MILESLFKTSAVVLVTGLLLIGVSAQGKSQGRGRGNSESSSAAAVTVVFRDSDRATFSDYFVTHKIAPQPLPPGIAKNVARGKPLPPGIAKRLLPADLLILAPKVERDVSFAIVGEAVVALKDGVVIDVMGGVFKSR